MENAMVLTKTRMQSGVWEGVLKTSAGTAKPEVEVIHLDQTLPSVSLTQDTSQPGAFVLRVPVPSDLLADGVQTFVIRDKASGDVLGSFTIVTGEPLDDDIRAEVALLRAELDLLKRAFRRHCSETT